MTYPFQPLFSLESAMKIRQSVNIPVAYVGGVLSLADMEAGGVYCVTYSPGIGK